MSMTQLIVRAFGFFAPSQNHKIYKNTQNTAKFGGNLLKYISIQQSYLKLFSAKLVNLSWNFVTKTVQTTSRNFEITRRRLCCEKLGTSYDVKDFAIGSVQIRRVLLLKEEMMTSVRKTLKTLVWSAQNWLISNEVFPENNHKIGPFSPIDFRLSLPWKFLRNR